METVNRNRVSWYEIYGVLDYNTEHDGTKIVLLTRIPWLRQFYAFIMVSEDYLDDMACLQ